ncbi:unnamed protein product [Leptidea sinapis]|uniref:Uncharacterized protein n=1 Tax=Leptidea sinapis TaxID=189913 RepID=A0A5E4R4V6_9NEOP|nr:unnamed protein product [Leptidea sinapis]
MADLAPGGVYRVAAPSRRRPLPAAARARPTPSAYP